MNKIIFIIGLLIMFSCKKEEDVFNYKLTYNDPSPANNAYGVSFRHSGIQFGGISKSGLADYVKEYRVYFDTINPPKHILKSWPAEIVVSSIFMLIPDKKYYWACTSLIPAGEIWSDIESFTTAGFQGDWKLSGIADKRGMIQYSQAHGYSLDWIDWSSWDTLSYKYIPDSNKWVVYIPKQDSILIAGLDIIEINIYTNGTNIKLYNQNSTHIINASFSYNVNNGSVLIKEIQNFKEHNFVAANICRVDSSNYNLFMLDEKGILFIYSSKSK